MTGERVAVKILEKDKIAEPADVERVTREIKVLKMLRHPNLIQLYEIVETSRQLCLVMEYCSGGELFDYIVASTRLKEGEACKFYQQVIAGLEYLHRLGVVHRDLKPENLLLDAHKNIKIVDFGLSNLYHPDQLLKTACGSPCYAAPEMIARKLYVPSKVDIWSSGVVLFAMVCGFLPFEDPSTSALYQKIMSGDYRCPKFLSAEVVDLLSKVLDTNPNTRATTARIKEHVWFRQVTQKLSTGVVLAETGQRMDSKVLGKLEQLGIDSAAAERALEENQYNGDTAT
jgi:5'-AMP-activated protein kinase catalytic alpha subunit